MVGRNLSEFVATKLREFGYASGGIEKQLRDEEYDMAKQITITLRLRQDAENELARGPVWRPDDEFERRFLESITMQAKTNTTTELDILTWYLSKHHHFITDQRAKTYNRQSGLVEKTLEAINTGKITIDGDTYKVVMSGNLAYKKSEGEEYFTFLNPDISDSNAILDLKKQKVASLKDVVDLKKQKVANLKELNDRVKNLESNVSSSGSVATFFSPNGVAEPSDSKNKLSMT